MSLSIMGSRYLHLKLLVDGYAKTGVDLIEYDGSGYAPMFVSDDIGIYCIIPKIAYYLGIHIDQAITLFFNGMTYGACIIGLAGLWCTYRTWPARAVSSLGLVLLTFFTCSQSIDVYRAYFAIAVAVIPWCIYFANKKTVTYSWYFFVTMAGIGIGLAHYVRSHSGTAVFLFIISQLIFHVFISQRNKLMLIACLITGTIVPALYFNHLYAYHKQYAQQKLPGCRIDEGQHVFWHPVYLGFGFLDNDLGIHFNDRVADDKVQSIAPGTPYPSPESEALLKQEVINLFKHHKFFFIYTIWAKIGIMLLYFLIFANLGIIAAYCYPLNWRINLSFVLALGFNSLFGILVMPSTAYTLGFISCAVLFGIVTLDNALERVSLKTCLSDIKRRFKHAKS